MSHRYSTRMPTGSRPPELSAGRNRCIQRAFHEYRDLSLSLSFQEPVVLAMLRNRTQRTAYLAVCPAHSSMLLLSLPLTVPCSGALRQQC